VFPQKEIHFDGVQNVFVPMNAIDWQVEAEGQSQRHLPISKSKFDGHTKSCFTTIGYALGVFDTVIWQ
jgi:hypothetical protein